MWVVVRVEIAEVMMGLLVMKRGCVDSVTVLPTMSVFWMVVWTERVSSWVEVVLEVTLVVVSSFWTWMVGVGVMLTTCGFSDSAVLMVLMKTLGASTTSTSKITCVAREVLRVCTPTTLMGLAMRGLLMVFTQVR